MNTFRLFAVVILLFIALNVKDVYAGDGINFEHGSWKEILAKAESQHKLIFLDAYASWCGPCKWMAKNVFTNDSVAEYFNNNFVNAKIDMEVGEGIELAREYGVYAYPSLLYINSKGELVHRTCGSVEPQQFITQGMDANNPEKQMISIKKKFEAYPSNSVLAKKYFQLMQEACAGLDEDIDKYIKTQKEADLVSRNNWDIINNYLTNYKTYAFKYLLKNRNKYAALYSADSVDQKISGIYSDGLKSNIRTDDLKAYKALKAEIKKSGAHDAEKIILNGDMALNKRQKNWKNYARNAEELINKYESENYTLLNSIAWTFYENIDDKALLLKAEKWAKKSTELKDMYFNNDTYAAVLSKLNKNDEAIAAAQKAIKLAKEEGADYSETESLLNKLRGI